MESGYIAQAGLKLPQGNPPTLASQSSGIRGVSHHAQPYAASFKPICFLVFHPRLGICNSSLLTCSTLLISLMVLLFSSFFHPWFSPNAIAWPLLITTVYLFAVKHLREVLFQIIFSHLHHIPERPLVCDVLTSTKVLKRQCLEQGCQLLMPRGARQINICVKLLAGSGVN